MGGESEGDCVTSLAARGEEPYVFSVADPRPRSRATRRLDSGCVRRTTHRRDEAAGLQAGPAPLARAPVDDRLPAIPGSHAYDKTDLDARVERVDESSPYWRRETVSFRAAYGNERVIAHLFLPTMRRLRIRSWRSRRFHDHEPQEGRGSRASPTNSFCDPAGRCDSRLQWHAREGALAVRRCRSQERERGAEMVHGSGPIPRLSGDQTRHRHRKLAFTAVSSGATLRVRLIAVDAASRPPCCVRRSFRQERRGNRPLELRSRGFVFPC